MPDSVIESVLNEKLNSSLLIKWLKEDDIQNITDDALFMCTKSEFVSYFLHYVRSQTDSILQTNSNAAQILHQNPTKKLSDDNKHLKCTIVPQNDHIFDCNKTKKTSRHTKIVTTNCKSDASIDSNLSVSLEKFEISSSTPIRNDIKSPDFNIISPIASKVTSDISDTPKQKSYKSDRSVQLGDYINAAHVKSVKKKKPTRNLSNEINNECKDLDISNTEVFPEIGAKRQEKRRIKPTNVGDDAKNFNSNFNSVSFKQVPLGVDNNPFRQEKQFAQNVTDNFETERSILKQDKQKLLEKFQLPTPNSVILTKPKSLDIQDFACPTKNYVKVNLEKVMLKEKLDTLIDIYDALIENNLILSINTEIYFLIAILVSEQTEDDYSKFELNIGANYVDFLLKSINNSTYFAVKSLWNQRDLLGIVLEKNSLKLLGENKRLGTFNPDLAKHLLNVYSLKCENVPEKPKEREISNSNGIICFNFETDNIDNFPSEISFRSFKKQRDMFYDVFRWYKKNVLSLSRSSFQNRVRALISSGTTAANHSHLAALFTAHMLVECLPQNQQQCRLSKLQQRLTAPSEDLSTRTHPHFTHTERYYRDFIVHSECEPFRVHLKDAFSSELVNLDATPIAVEELMNSNNEEFSIEYLKLMKKLCLLAKFLGYLTALPYLQIEHDATNRNTRSAQKTQKNPTKERVVENSAALRWHSQPSLDLKGILSNAQKSGRLLITLPWLINYLSALDYTSLRIKYFKDIQQSLVNIYRTKLKPGNNMRINTIVYLKCLLGWLFSLPHYPQELFQDWCENHFVPNKNCIDACNVVNETVLFELCPHLKDTSVLLSTCKVDRNDRSMGSCRHITPVTLSLDPEDRLRSKEKELQQKLEDELLRAQPASSRRALDLVAERVASAGARELAARAHDVRVRARVAVVEACACERGDRSAEQQEQFLQHLESVYQQSVKNLQEEESSRVLAAMKARCEAAVTALLPHSTPALANLAVRAAKARFTPWLRDNWHCRALCKDIRSEVKSLQASSETLSGLAVNHKSAFENKAALDLPKESFRTTHVSPAFTIINLKDLICTLWQHGTSVDSDQVLKDSALCCSSDNVFFSEPIRWAILRLTLDLCIVTVSRRPLEVTQQFLNQLHKVWDICCPLRSKNVSKNPDIPEIRPPSINNDYDSRAPTPISDDEITDKNDDQNKNNKIIYITEQYEDQKQSDCLAKAPIIDKLASANADNISFEANLVPNCTLEKSDDSHQLLNMFQRVLCPRNLMILNEGSSKNTDVWTAMTEVLVFMLENAYLSDDSLVEQCVAVYRQDWPQNVLENLSKCIKSVIAKCGDSLDAKLSLFLDFLSEYCEDMDYDIQ